MKNFTVTIPLRSRTFKRKMNSKGWLKIAGETLSTYVLSTLKKRYLYYTFPSVSFPEDNQTASTKFTREISGGRVLERKDNNV